MINILFTCVGRRVELVQQFQKAKAAKNIQGSILCSDMSPLAPALYYGDDHFILPALKDKLYIDALLQLCIDQEVSLIIPTIDTELELLTENANRFEAIGTKLLVANGYTIQLSQDKYLTFKFFKSLGLDTPSTYLAKEMDNIELPCFAKPSNGSSSINTFKINSKRELDFFKDYIPNCIIQDYIIGTEYSIDIFSDFDGNPIYITPRIRLATRSGEVLKSKIVHDLELINFSKMICEKLKSTGPITIQAIKSNTDNKYYFIEINARFGGGSPLSMMAGADSASILYDLLLGKEPCIANNIEYNTVFSRFDQTIMLLEKEDNNEYEKI